MEEKQLTIENLKEELDSLRLELEKMDSLVSSKVCY